jgi:uncharacterized repeat protein (TIGR01451 family)
MCTLKSTRLLALGLAAIYGLSWSTSVLAVGTDAGTQIDNIATVGYKVGGVVQTAEVSPTSTFFVDQVVDFVVTEPDAADTDVGAGELDAVARFTVTNTGNATQDFALSVLDLVGGTVFSLDTIQADALTIVIDANDNDVYDAGTDTVANFIDELSAVDAAAADADNVISVFILGDIPAAASGGDAANIELTATAHVAGVAGLGAAEAETGGNDDPSSVEIIFAAAVDSGATATAAAQDGYLVGVANLAAVKTSTVVLDPLGQTSPLALAIPGAIVQYEVTISNTGGLAATEVQVTDAIQSDLTFETGTYNGAASDVEIVVGVSAAVYCIAEIGGVDTNGDGCFRNVAGDSLTVSIPVSVTYPTGLTVGILAPNDEVTVRFQASIN